MSSETIEMNVGTEDEHVMGSLAEALRGVRENAHVGRAFGDPIQENGKTIIPVARVVYGFGGGLGTDAETGEGGEGGGGGVMTRPIGVLEITDHDTRFVRFTDWKRLLAMGVLGALIGIVLGRR